MTTCNICGLETLHIENGFRRCNDDIDMEEYDYCDVCNNVIGGRTWLKKNPINKNKKSGINQQGNIWSEEEVKQWHQINKDNQ